MATDSRNVLIIIPARNEEKSLSAVLKRLSQLFPDLPILVVNDASTDTTASVIEEFPHVLRIDLPFWMGYGGALQVGYKYASREGYDAVVQLDADGQHDPSSISDLLEALKEADVVVGSRFLDRTNAYEMSVFRRLGCRFLSLLAQILTGIRVTDPTSGFQALNRKALHLVVQDHYPMDYPDVDVLIMLHRSELKVREVPVRMKPADDHQGMHEGLQVWYYALKMTLSMLVMMLRKG